MNRGGPPLDLLLAEAGVGSVAVGWSSCGGGCIADVRRVRLAAGRTFVVKIFSRSGSDPTGFNSRAHEEAAGLAAIAASGSVWVPEVIGIGDSDDHVMLVLEDLGEATRATESDWSDFGVRLAELHAGVDAVPFGFDHDNHLGHTRQDNSPSEDSSNWSDFLRQRRLGPMRRRLEDAGLLDSIDRDLLERLEEGLAGIIPAGIRPSLLHGDLWSGNVHPTEQRGIVVIDPATFHGDPLFDLGMMRLFGGFPRGCETSYFDRLVEIRGADALDAAEVRIELGRLHHLMNHWLLFGAGYAHNARRTASGLVSKISR